MLGGVCYVDLFAGTFQGIEAEIPYFQELGLTYLHLMPPFFSPRATQRRRLRGQQLSPDQAITSATLTICAARRPSCASRHLAGARFRFQPHLGRARLGRASAAGDPAYRDPSTTCFPIGANPDAHERTFARNLSPTNIPVPSRKLPDGRWVQCRTSVLRHEMLQNNSFSRLFGGR